MLLTERNIQTEAYSHNRLEYDVTCSKARLPSARGDQGGIGLVRRERPDGWGVESTRFHGTNMVRCDIVTGPTHTPLVGAYLPPLMLEHLPDVKEALQRFKGRDPIVLGDLNVDLDGARISRSQCMADLLTEYGIIDLVQQFR